VKLGDDEISLADLAGFDMSNVEAKRFENLPEGHFQFEIVSDPLPDLKKITSAKGDKAIVVIGCKVLNVTALNNPADAPNGDATGLIGKVHNENAILNSADSLGYLMATLQDLQAQNGPLRQMLHGLAGTKFDAFIKHRADPNDSDKKYASLRKITNVQKPTVSNVLNAA
jgi:hypothetical protein